MKHVVVLTGAGMSAESGIKTFRDANGLWEEHDIMEVASPQGFAKNPELVLEFYNQRRRQLHEVAPNNAHLAIAELEKDFKVTVVTQNIDDLHERAGSTNIVHLHGELFKARSAFDDTDIFECRTDIKLGDTCKKGYQIRPHIVWFGETVPMIEKAIDICGTADILLIIGTSMQVYPAASLINYVNAKTKVYYIDPKPAISSNYQITVISETATKGMEAITEMLLKST